MLNALASTTMFARGTTSFVASKARAARSFGRASNASKYIRHFRTTAVRRDGVVGSAPARRPIGGFRGGLFGFFFGTTVAGAAMYYYILEDYKISNQLLTEDIFALQSAVQRIESYTKNLEAEIADIQKKRLQS